MGRMKLSSSFRKVSVLVIVMLLSLIGFSFSFASSNIVTVSFVDVGQGDSALRHDENANLSQIIFTAGLPC